MNKNHTKNRNEEAAKKLTLDDLAKVRGGLSVISDSDDEEREYPQRKSRFPKAPDSISFY